MIARGRGPSRGAASLSRAAVLRCVRVRRLVAPAVLVVAALVLGYLARGGGDRAAPRAATDSRLARDLEVRVVELERRMDFLEAQRATPLPGTGGPAPANAPAPAPAADRRAPATPGERDQERDALRRDYVQRFRDAPTPERRLLVLREAAGRLKKDAGADTVRGFLEEILRSVDAASEEGIEAAFLLSYEARGDGDYAASDELIRGVERIVPRDSAAYAQTQFQLAWNRKFAGDDAAAEDLFRRAAGVRDVNATTKVAAYYAIASLRGDSGDAAGARQHLDLVMEEGRKNPADMGVAYYVGLAKTLLAALPE